MKKAIIFIAIIAISLIMAGQDLNAQYYGTDSFLTVGTITDDSFSFSPFYWTAGLALDIHFGELFMLSPEGFIQVHNLEFGTFYIVPSVLLNLKLSSLFAGGGITKSWEIGSDTPGTFSSDIQLKVNAGFRGTFTKLAVYIITPFDYLFKRPLTIGASLGFGF